MCLSDVHRAGSLHGDMHHHHGTCQPWAEMTDQAAVREDDE